MVIHHCLPFADERHSVKCLGSAAGVSFPSPPLPPPPAPTFLLLFPQCPRALTPLGLKETETTATQATLPYIITIQLVLNVLKPPIIRCTINFLAFLSDEQMRDEVAGTTAIVVILKNQKIYCVRIKSCVLVSLLVLNMVIHIHLSFPYLQLSMFLLFKYYKLFFLFVREMLVTLEQ